LFGEKSKSQHLKDSMIQFPWVIYKFIEKSLQGKP
jgi:hypothetical protein